MSRRLLPHVTSKEHEHLFFFTSFSIPCVGGRISEFGNMRPLLFNARGLYKLGVNNGIGEGARINQCRRRMMQKSIRHFVELTIPEKSGAVFPRANSHYNKYTKS